MEVIAALMAYDAVLDAIHRTGTRPTTADKIRAMSAAIEAYEAEKALTKKDAE